MGGGLSGLGAAWSLRDRGVSVALLEAETLASGASGRNAGFILGGPASSFRNSVDLLGVSAAADIWRFTLANNRCMGAIVEEFDLECGYLRRGSMSLAASGEEMEELAQTHHLLVNEGISTGLVRADDLPLPFHRLYAGGLYYPGNAEINSGLFVRSVAKIVAGHVKIYERTPVRSLNWHNEWLLHTSSGRVHCGIVILCTNAYSSQLAAQVPIKPVRGQVLATTPLTRVIVPCPMYANFGYQYWRQTPEGRLVVGGWRDTDFPAEDTDRDELNAGIQGRLRAFSQVLAGEQPLEKQWSGIMGFTPDMYPLVGSMPGCDSMFVAMGYSGHGVSMAFQSGMRVASRAAGDEVTIPLAFDPARFIELSRPAL